MDNPVVLALTIALAAGTTIIIMIRFVVDRLTQPVRSYLSSEACLDRLDCWLFESFVFVVLRGYFCGFYAYFQL